MIHKTKNIFPHAVLFQFYHAMVHLQLLYGLIIWLSTYLCYLQKLQILQNKALRNVNVDDNNAQLILFTANLKLLQINNLVNFETAKFALN